MNEPAHGGHATARAVAKVEHQRVRVANTRNLENGNVVRSQCPQTSIEATRVSVNSPHRVHSKSTTPATWATHRVLQLLLDSNLTSFATDIPPHLLSHNAFAMEYAARATRLSLSWSRAQSASVWSAPSRSNEDNASTVVRGKVVRTNKMAHQSRPPPQPSNLAQPTILAQVVTRKNGRQRCSNGGVSHASKPYTGEEQENHFDRLIYMSRMQGGYSAMNPSGNTDHNDNIDRPWMELAGRNVLRDGVANAFEVAKGNSGGKSSTATNFTAYLNESGSTMNSIQCTQQQRCSLTLSNWSFNPENACLLVEENGVEALIRLCRDGDKTTRLHCVTALMNLSHVWELRSRMVQQGAVQTVAEMVNNRDDETIRTACAITLCNLCSLQGQEGILVEHGAVSALSILITEHEKVAHICRSALFNLTCVSQSYHKIERVLKAFIALALTRIGTGLASRLEVKYDEITAKGLCNLSNLKRMRLRLVEEGVLSCLPLLLHPTVSSIQELLARTLLNLSRLATCRNGMVAKGCMGTLVALANASSAMTTKSVIGTILWDLSKDPNNVGRMVLEGLLVLVNDLCTTAQADLFLYCARTLYNVSCCEEARAKLVERNAAATLAYISERSSGETNQICTLALCNLLSVQTAAAAIVATGAITALIQLSVARDQTLEARYLFSQAFHGLCDNAVTRVAATDAQVVPALLFLSSTDDVIVQHSVRPNILGDTRARCVVALACLAADAQTATYVCNVAVVQCVTSILALEHANVAVARYCCSCLSLLCQAEQCCRCMVEVGAMTMVLALCGDARDHDSKASCCHVLASVSRDPSCCFALVQMGIVDVVATLASIKDDAVIQRCCVITLANLSVDPTTRATLASPSVVAIVTVVSNSYNEESQRDCAKVLCNLSCIRENAVALVHAGAVNVLLLISMVRAVSVRTKETCVRALLNVLTEDTIQCMVDEGLVQLVAPLAQLASTHLPLLLTLLGLKLTTFPCGRDALCTDQAALHALFHLMTHDDRRRANVATLHVQLVRQFVYHDTLRLPSVQAGLFYALDRMSVDAAQEGHVRPNDRPSDKAALTLARVLFVLARHKETRLALASSLCGPLLWPWLALDTVPMDQRACQRVRYGTATLCWLAWHKETRIVLCGSRVLRVLVHMVQVHAHQGSTRGYPLEALRTCVLTLCCLAQIPDVVDQLLVHDVVTHLRGVVPMTGTCGTAAADVVALVSILFRQLSRAAEFVRTSAPSRALFCVLVRPIQAMHDMAAAQDCAEALCSLVFASIVAPCTLDGERVPVDSNVLAALALLVETEQFPATRWHCCATLWALTSVVAYRTALVQQGVTRMVVAECSRRPPSVPLDALQYCASALCNLTMVPQETTAATMVADGAIPALLELAKLDRPDIRDHCTLALSNLSGSSPTVEAGAMAALLHMSRALPRATGTLATASATTARWPQGASLCRPPLGRNKRHKEVAVRPDYAIDERLENQVVYQTFEADVAASTPPAPHVPVLLTPGGSGKRIHPTLESGTSQGAWEREEESKEGIQTTFYEKVNPKVSVALLTAMTEQGKDEDEPSHRDNPVQLALFRLSTSSIQARSNQSNSLLAVEQATERIGAPKRALLPLARVVTQQ